MNKKIPQTITKGVAKVPVVMQLEALECGAASLAMVLAYYGKWIPLEQVRKDCGVSRDGSKAKNIYIAAENYGFDVKAFRMSPENLKKEGKFPCIIHWNMNHFVVLDGFRGNKVYINDPARGNVTVSWEEFDKAFTGVVIIPVPNDSFKPEGKQRSTIDFAKKRLIGAGAAVAFVMITTALSYLFGIIDSVTSRIFMDRLLTGRNREWLYPFISILVLLASIQVIVAWVQTIYSLKINGKMAAVGSSSYMWKVLRLPMEFYSQRLAGDIQGRLALNSSIAGTLVNTFAPLLLNSVMMIFYLVIMLRQSSFLTLVGLVTLVLNIFMSRIISNKRVNIARVYMRDSGKLEAATVTGIEMIETIKASGAENGFFEKWAGYQASVNSQEIKTAKTDLYWGVIPEFFTIIADYAVLVLGVYMTMQGQFTLGSVLMFQGFLAAFMAPASTLISAGQTIQEMRTQMERVEDVMGYPDDEVFDYENGTSDNTSSGDESISKLRGNIELQNITFGYSRLEEPLIKDFSLSIKSGDRVAVVGASGCGKSTLSKIISGLYQPWSGQVLFDGRPRSSFPRDVVTGSVAVVDQDIILFEDTIEENIRMWDESIKDFEVIMAARDAQLHDDILCMQGGYKHKITSGGKDLSGGQRQRMEIARVLAQDPTIIILDEATSALDARTEYDVVRSIKDRGITCIVIAHRLSTVRDCDKIIVLDHGDVVECGTHDELMKLGGSYAELVASE
ncbi:NHLM bacteriocin system ABC transporter, peptidase/ATP-binding protein [Lachnospiraceae bacterium NE2001]|nr:NHLM bacteriocin system ABC transporter, peptidase/ATP-binding protein [Lachnospiraceae bacterium NE2001]